MYFHPPLSLCINTYTIQSYLHCNRKTPKILYIIHTILCTLLLLNNANHGNFTGSVTYVQSYMRKYMKTKAHQPTNRYKCSSSSQFNGVCSSKANLAVLFTKFINFRYYGDVPPHPAPTVQRIHENISPFVNMKFSCL